MGLDRAAFADLVETPKGGGAVRSTWPGGRLLTDLTRAGVMERMPKGSVARFLGTMSGGGETHTVSRWWVPGFGRRDLIVTRGALDHLEVFELEPDAPAQASLFG